MSARILLVGGTGFLGKRVCELLIQQGHHVILCARNNTYPDRPNYTFVQYDCLHPHTFPGEQIGKIDYAIYLAQPKQYNDFPGQARDIFYINSVSLFELAEHCHKVGCRKLIYASSGGVFSPGQDMNPLEESTLVLPRKESGFYLGTKLLSENILKYFEGVIPYTILRYFFIYGPNQRAEMLFPRLVKTIKDGGHVSLKGPNGFFLNPIYVDDAANMTVESLIKDTPNVLNIAGPETINLKQLVDEMSLTMGIAPNYKYVEGNPDNYIADTTLAQTLFSPARTRLKEGLRKFINEHA
jgi:UDP-glucose 4-epimerase